MNFQSSEGEGMWSEPEIETLRSAVLNHRTKNGAIMWDTVLTYFPNRNLSELILQYDVLLESQQLAQNLALAPEPEPELMPDILSLQAAIDPAPEAQAPVQPPMPALPSFQWTSFQWTLPPPPAPAPDPIPAPSPAQAPESPDYSLIPRLFLLQLQTQLLARLPAFNHQSPVVLHPDVLPPPHAPLALQVPPPAIAPGRVTESRKRPLDSDASCSIEKIARMPPPPPPQN